jgi:hypothetical protein
MSLRNAASRAPRAMVRTVHAAAAVTLSLSVGASVASATNVEDSASAGASDGAGGVIVCGLTHGSLGGPTMGSTDAWFVRYDGAGSDLGPAARDDPQRHRGDRGLRRSGRRVPDRLYVLEPCNAQRWLGRHLDRSFRGRSRGSALLHARRSQLDGPLLGLERDRDEDRGSQRRDALSQPVAAAFIRSLPRESLAGLRREPGRQPRVPLCRRTGGSLRGPRPGHELGRVGVFPAYPRPDEHAATDGERRDTARRDLELPGMAPRLTRRCRDVELHGCHLDHFRLRSPRGLTRAGVVSRSGARAIASSSDVFYELPFGAGEFCT